MCPYKDKNFPLPSDIDSIESGQVMIRPGTVILNFADDLLQVGSSPENSFVLSNATKEDERWLRSLVGIADRRAFSPSNSTQEIVIEGSVDPERKEMIICLLRKHNLLVGDIRSRTPDLRIRVVGLDRVGIPLARMLSSIGAQHIDVRDSRRIDSSVEYLFPPTNKGQSRKLAVQEELSSQGVYTAKHGYPHLVINVSDRVVDHQSAGLLLTHDIWNLPIVSEDRSITVGPLIIPGYTCCHLCIDHHRTDEIPSWPIMRETLQRTPLPAQLLPLTTAVAARAAGLMNRLFGDSSSTKKNLEAIRNHSWRFSDTGLETTVWRPHPSCGCTSSKILSLSSQDTSLPSEE